jgi:16S rRNA (guanine527-N7)-methyltransferase
MIKDPELQEKLSTYAHLLEAWQKKVNLIAPSTVPTIESRHFEDSLQLLKYIDTQSESQVRVVDLGSGAGFPGMVLAMANPVKLSVTLIESDLKKCLFLENVSRETSTPVTLIRSRIEHVKDVKADILISRALAPLPQLLEYAYPFLEENSICLFLKGKNAETEIQMAENKWEFELEIFSSLTDSTGRILKISHLKKKS